MMGMSNEKATTDDGQTDLPEPSTLNNPDVNNVGGQRQDTPGKACPRHGRRQVSAWLESDTPRRGVRCRCFSDCVGPGE